MFFFSVAEGVKGIQVEEIWSLDDDASLKKLE